MSPRAAESAKPTAARPPGMRHERRAQRAGALRVAGVDEAGRGPLAGPVVTAAVVFTGRVPKGLNDSKLLAPDERERLHDEIHKVAEVSVAVASAARIDTMNILAATLWAMRRAVHGLFAAPDHVLVDGRDLPAGFPCGGEAVIGGDRLCASIAAASIIAKVTRDRLMVRAAGLYPDYGFEQHMGYGTPQHLRALREFGVSPIHRMSFAPVREARTALAG